MQLLDELEAVPAAAGGGGGGGGDGGGRRSGKVSEFRDRELCLVSQTELSKISVGAQGPRSGGRKRYPKIGSHSSVTGGGDREA